MNTAHRPRIALVVAIAENGVIGKDGGLPWRIPADMRWFKAVTMGKPVIMGRKTWDSLPKKPLPGRANIVISRAQGWTAEGALAAASLDEALRLAGASEEVCVIGGAQIYAEALPRADRLYLTEVLALPDGDTFMPPIDRSRFHVISREDNPAEGTAPAFGFLILDRIDS